MRHANWNPTKHKRLPNGQWAPTGKGKFVTAQKPRSYASRRSHASQVGRHAAYVNHNAKIKAKKAKYRKAIGAALVLGGVAAAAYGGSNLVYARALKGGPRR